MNKKQKQALVVNLRAAKERLKRCEERAGELERASPTAFVEIRQAKNAVQAARAIVELYASEVQKHAQGVGGV